MRTETTLNVYRRGTTPLPLGSRAPQRWALSCANTESTLHQLSPYIGKLKSTIAHDLIQALSRPGDLVLDPFAGSGTIPLESVLANRKALACDVSLYSEVLTRGKLAAPPNIRSATERAVSLLEVAALLPQPDLRTVPSWVRQFFHPKTLKETLRFAQACQQQREYFFFACLLGILHHQRSGFLSFPSSHLVPYLRTTKFPRDKFPELYEYRELRPRLLAKIERAYKRFGSLRQKAIFLRTPIQDLKIQKLVDCIITSPPYMNALDYARDNRLRIWFIDRNADFSAEDARQRKESFISAIRELGGIAENHLKPKGYCAVIVGEQILRRGEVYVATMVKEIFSELAPSLMLLHQIRDRIPDIRRCRREYRGTKTEYVLVFQRR